MTILLGPSNTTARINYNHTNATNSYRYSAIL
jgi:hypothetical protein